MNASRVFLEPHQFGHWPEPLDRVEVRRVTGADIHDSAGACELLPGMDERVETEAFEACR